MIETLLQNLPEKGSGDLNTTSRKFKRDLYDFFNKPDFKNQFALEIGCHWCHTSVVLSHLFRTVYALQEVYRVEADRTIRQFNRDNITLVVHDMYGGGPIPLCRADVVFIDAMHSEDAVKSDVKNALELVSKSKKYFVFDDYGACEGVKRGVDSLISNGTLTKIQSIGIKKGEPWLISYPLLDDEGIICREV